MDFSPNVVHSMFDIAFEEASLALEAREVPVGCVFASKSSNSIFARGRNRVNETLNATKHAEIVAIEQFLETAEFNLNREEKLRMIKDSCMYVTCEPCVMCADFLNQIGVSTVVFGCVNEKFGGCGSVLSINQFKACQAKTLNPKYGIYEDRGIELLQRFYNRANPESLNQE